MEGRIKWKMKWKLGLYQWFIGLNWKHATHPDFPNEVEFPKTARCHAAGSLLSDGVEAGTECVEHE